MPPPSTRKSAGTASAHADGRVKLQTLEAVDREHEDGGATDLHVDRMRRGRVRRGSRRGGGLEPFVAPLGTAPDQVDDRVDLGRLDTDQEGDVLAVQEAA